MELVKDLGEHELLRRLNRYCASDFVGDDGALVDVDEGKQLVVTTDMLIDEVHFCDRTTPPFMVGWRSVTANLSDLAAMGATPLGITVALSIPPQTPVCWLELLYKGMKACLDEFDSYIIGGDLTRGKNIAISITALGQVNPQQKILRNLAKPNDVVLITGNHGLSSAGLEILLNPDKYQAIDPQIKQKLILAHQQPQPRLDVIDILHQNKINHPIAGMDSSDGLGDAIIQICQQSQVGATIDRQLIPVSPTITAITDKNTAWHWILYGGEDFELILCVKPELAELLTQKYPSQFIAIGTITQNPEITLIDSQNFYPKVLLTQTEIFNHF